MTPHSARRVTPRWSLALRDALGAAQSAADGLTTIADPPGTLACEAAAEALGDALGTASATFGLDDEIGWALLDLRDVLTSHLVASRAVADIVLGHDAARRLLGRGIDEVARGLASLPVAIVATPRSYSRSR
jgi:hypothetical protein